MKCNEYFDVTTTDVLFYDRLLKGQSQREKGKELSHVINYMTPDDYLSRCTIINNCTLDEIHNMIDETNVEELLEVVVKEKLPLPFINYVSNGQEGRHRAIVAKRLGLDIMPVMIITGE
ncbi:hypothetical protein ABEY43_06755 [Priestia megaterium]